MSGLRKLPPAPTPPAWVVVYTTYNIPEAQIVAGRLNYEGIPALVSYPIGGSAMGITTLGAVSVLVHPDHYQQAMNLLALDETNALPDTTDAISYSWEDEDDDYDEDEEAYDDEE